MLLYRIWEKINSLVTRKKATPFPLDRVPIELWWHILIEIHGLDSRDRLKTLSSLYRTNFQWRRILRQNAQETLSSPRFKELILPPWMKSINPNDPLRESTWRLENFQAYMESIRQLPREHRDLAVFLTVPSHPIGFCWDWRIQAYRTIILNDPSCRQYHRPARGTQSIELCRHILKHYVVILSLMSDFVEVEFLQQENLIILWWNDRKDIKYKTSVSSWNNFKQRLPPLWLYLLIWALLCLMTIIFDAYLYPNNKRLLVHDLQAILFANGDFSQVDPDQPGPQNGAVTRPVPF
ncbi:uncharacterized protein KY384_007357 [Bacidia gigantensis]|uniref:uncharacterized protein n=1 Tax=Bacidia gigantensis TaxID=2732470 RepID=UPI001D037DCB|nr:uncharacterized protein KY384_007357 [Bacidia gigantensis]KAG8528439.1 hypothetical protein KY384_007357 [Bacidia gigantensis]